MDGKLNLFAVMAKRMDWLAQRQRVLAENVANSDTPKYVPKDLNDGKFLSVLRRGMRPVEPQQTNASHLGGTALRDGPANASRQKETYETSPSGNAVVLEEQLMKVARTQDDFQTMTNLYRKNMDMFRIALRGSK